MLSNRLSILIFKVVLPAIIAFGLFFRLQGISSNHSFWSDEAYLATSAKNIVTGKVDLVDQLKKQDYQPLHLLLITTSFKLFGISEWSARLYPAIAGTLGIIFAFLLTRKLSNPVGGLLAAFFMAFSQLNLANSTQAKQYTAIQTGLLIILYSMTVLSEKNQKINWRFHFLITLIATIGSLLHFLGILLWVPYLIFIVLNYHQEMISVLKKPAKLIALFFLLICLSLIINLPLMAKTFFRGQTISEIFFPYNHLVYFFQLFGKQYWLFVLVAIFGWIFIWPSNRFLAISIAGYIAISLYLWTFKHYTHNVRYVVPLFGVIFTFAAAGLGLVYQRNKSKRLSVLLVISFIFLAIVSHKLELQARTFYNPNFDIYGDVQIADYKTTFLLLKQHFPNHQRLAIINDVPFAQNWYLPQKKATAYLTKFTNIPYTSNVDGVITYGRVSDFKKIIKQYPQGLVIIEDWQSFLPESVKIYAKAHLNHEFTVNSLGGTEHDPWPVSIYSWGL